MSNNIVSNNQKYTVQVFDVGEQAPEVVFVQTSLQQLLSGLAQL